MQWSWGTGRPGIIPEYQPRPMGIHDLHLWPAAFCLHCFILLSKSDRNNTNTDTHTTAAVAVIYSAALRLRNYHTDLIKNNIVPSHCSTSFLQKVSQGNICTQQGLVHCNPPPPQTPTSDSTITCETFQRLVCPQILTVLSRERADPAGLINKFRMMKRAAMKRRL